jgi:hypothetical protein
MHDIKLKKRIGFIYKGYPRNSSISAGPNHDKLIIIDEGKTYRIDNKYFNGDAFDLDPCVIKGHLICKVDNDVWSHHLKAGARKLLVKNFRPDINSSHQQGDIILVRQSHILHVITHDIYFEIRHQFNEYAAIALKKYIAIISINSVHLYTRTGSLIAYCKFNELQFYHDNYLFMGNDDEMGLLELDVY